MIARTASEQARRTQRKDEFARWKEAKARRRIELKSYREKGQAPPPRPSPSNAKGGTGDREEEAAERRRHAEDYLKVMNRKLPGILKRLSRISDPRDTKKTKHRIDIVLLFGLLTFLLQKASRREANRELNSAALMALLREVFPDLEEWPHHDTVNRLLDRIDIREIEDVHLNLLRQWIRKKKFRRHIIGQSFTVAVDGTQKTSRDVPWAKQCLKTTSGSSTRYYCYTLEACLVCSTGLILPMMTEFCEFEQGANDKQDCEYRAFERLTARLKTAFPRLRITLVLDGLYPCGPIFARIRKYKWDFMITLKDLDLPSIWEEAWGLRRLRRSDRNGESATACRTWGGREQSFWWSNDIAYEYGKPMKTEIVHLVVCNEQWREADKKTRTIELKTGKFAWVSSQPLHRRNIHQRCNLTARSRWCIEESILVEKHHGYRYEHLFSTSWNAMKGYHLLMRMAHAINEMAFQTALLAPVVARKGRRAFIRYIERTMTGNWVEPIAIREAFSKPYQLRAA